MATGVLVKPYDGYEEFTITKNSEATNWTIMESYAYKMGQLGFLQLVVSVTASEPINEGAAVLFTLPQKMYPKHYYKNRFSSGEQGVDYNVTITTSGEFQITRMPQKGGNIRINVVYMTATAS